MRSPFCLFVAANYSSVPPLVAVAEDGVQTMDVDVDGVVVELNPALAPFCP